MRILLFASGAFAVPTVEWLARGAHGIAGLVTQPRRRSGRGRHAVPMPAGQVGESLGLRVFEMEHVNAAESLATIRALDAELGVVIAFGQKLGGALLSALPHGCINLHASLLPKYRGAAPINWAILRGEMETGVTVFWLSERIDAGDILVQRATPIGETETAGELHDRLAMLGPDALGAAIERFEREGSPVGVSQDPALVSIAPKLTKESGLLDFRFAADLLARQVRAMTPWPGARCGFRSRQRDRVLPVAICRARAVAATSSISADADAVGQITAWGTVRTGEGELDVMEIQPAGKRVMSWSDFVNGQHVVAGDRFEALS